MDGAEGAGTVRERARRHLDVLSAAERKVARVLLAAYPIAGLESVTRLAERAAVSGPTVTRFVTKLGFDGYRDFQNALRSEVQAAASSPLVRYQERPSTSEGELRLASTLVALGQVLEETSRTIPPAEFDAVVALLADRRRTVACLGGRLSHVAAYYLFARLHQLRKGTRCLGLGPTTSNDQLVDLTRRDVLVVFDYRRYQDDTVTLARRAAARGTTVILFTDRWLSPAADIATHVLVCPVETPSPFDSLVAAVGIVEALVTAVLTRLGDQARSRIEELEHLRAMQAPDRPGAVTE